MRMLSTILLGAALVATGSVASAAPRLKGEAKLQQMLEGRVAGKPVNCINQRNITSSEIVDKTAIVYRVGSKLYVNRPKGGQNSLDNDDILVTRITGSQLCNIDIVRLVDRASQFETGFVSLGEFVPYTRIAARN